MCLLDEIIGSNGNYERPRILKARILEETGAFKKALDLYEDVVTRDGASMSSKCELAWLLATCPDEGIRDGHRAVLLAEDVSSATLHLSVLALDVLAAAYAETGRYDDAVRTATRALKLAAVRQKDSAMRLADGTDDTTTEPPAAEQLSEIAKRMESYKEGRPFRMEIHAGPAATENGSM